MIAALNLGLRFLLEIAGLVAIGYWGFHRGEGALRWALMLIPPLVLAAIWGMFRVPGDGGDPVVAVPGVLRLALELGVFTLAVLALNAAGQRAPALVLLVIVIGHYIVDWERVGWLLRQQA